jgi:hypothetical protein
VTANYYFHLAARLNFCVRVLVAARVLYGESMWKLPLGEEWCEWADTIGLER